MKLKGKERDIVSWKINLTRKFKIISYTIICIVIVLFSAQLFAASYASINNKLFILEQSVRNIADSIATYNKPAFEAQLTKKERTYDDWEMGITVTGVIWNRVWAKDNTVVLGSAAKDKKFGALIFKTTDPKKMFSGGIHVGSTKGDLENFLGASLNTVAKALNNMTSDRSVITKGNKITITGPVQETDAPEDPLVIITCENGIITEIFMSWTDVDLEGCISQKAINFANQKAKEMGMSNLK